MAESKWIELLEMTVAMKEKCGVKSVADLSKFCF